MHLARVLRDAGLAVIETYRGAAYRGWGSTGASLSDILSARVTGLRAVSDDECDAIAVALVAKDRAKGRAVPLPGADGTIWLPAEG